MDQLQPTLSQRELARSATTEYIFDMIEQIATLARRSGEAYVAIHLEAIIAARREVATDRSAQ